MKPSCGVRPHRWAAVDKWQLLVGALLGPLPSLRQAVEECALFDVYDGAKLRTILAAAAMGNDDAEQSLMQDDIVSLGRWHYGRGRSIT
jgi:hypothetical protein